MNRAARRHPSGEIDLSNLSSVPLVQPKPTQAGASVVALVRQLDENGTYFLTEGHSMRTDYVDAEQLIAAVRLVVREELERVLGEPEHEAGTVAPDSE